MKLKHGKFKLEIKQSGHFARLFLNGEYIALISLHENGEVRIVPITLSIRDCVSLTITRLKGGEGERRG